MKEEEKKEIKNIGEEIERAKKMLGIERRERLMNCQREMKDVLAKYHADLKIAQNIEIILLD